MDLDLEIYTRCTAPFRFGGTESLIKTRDTAVCIVMLGKGRTGHIFHNRKKNLWHIAESTCGAIIGTGKDFGILVGQVIQDVSSGDEAVMDAQVEQGLKDRESAKHIAADHFWLRFKSE